jgi:hypothetical protein
MISVNDGFCVLTRVTGRFAGGGESVRISLGWDGVLYLGGTSQQIDVGASARCVRYADLGIAVPPEMAPEHDVLRQRCRRPRVTYSTGGYTSWAPANAGPVATRACAVRRHPRGRRGRVRRRSCYLTSVTGRFYGAGESVWVTRGSSKWLLGGSSQQSGVAARARCINARDASGAVLGQATWGASAHCFLVPFFPSGVRCSQGGGPP